MALHKRVKSSGVSAARKPSVNQYQKNRSTHSWAGEPRSRRGCHSDRGPSAAVRRGMAAATRPNTQSSKPLGRPSIFCCPGSSIVGIELKTMSRKPRTKPILLRRSASAIPAGRSSHAKAEEITCESSLKGSGDSDSRWRPRRRDLRVVARMDADSGNNCAWTASNSAAAVALISLISGNSTGNRRSTNS